MQPYQWFATAGDETGDANHQTAYGSESAPSPSTHNVWTPGAGATGAMDGLGVSPDYITAAMQQVGQQTPVSGTPATMNGPQQGPWYTSNYADAVPSRYISAVPLWKNGPMQAAASRVPSVPTVPANQAPLVTGGTCAGCAGGCSGKRGQQCAGRSVNLDQNVFAPLYSQPNASPVEVSNGILWNAVSNHHTGWAANHGAAPDTQEPVQGH